MKIEWRGSKIFRDDVLVGMVMPSFEGAWFSYFWGEARGPLSKKFHEKANAIADAEVRARRLTAAEACKPVPGTVFSKPVRPVEFSD